MLKFTSFIAESLEQDKLKHLEHAEDWHIKAGAAGAQHALNTLNHVHNALLGKRSQAQVTTKIDGSPSVVFGYHPENGRFFVASKSAFNVNPKINYTPEDIERNHGHAPGLVEKLKAALQHLHKITPKKKGAVFQGDMTFSGNDKRKSGDSIKFKPNVIEYSVDKNHPEYKSIDRAKVGVAVHTQYRGDTLQNMKADFTPDKLVTHPDVHQTPVTLQPSSAKYTPQQQKAFNEHMTKAKALASSMSKQAHDAVGVHADHLSQYINSTVSANVKPTFHGLHSFIAGKMQGEVDKVKTEKAKTAKSEAMTQRLDHLLANKQHLQHALDLHHHIQTAKNQLVNALAANPSYEHSINGQKVKPEGFVATVGGKPTKLNDRYEFNRLNRLARQ